MSRKELGICLVLLVLGGCKQKAPPLPSSPVLDRAALVRGAIPQGEESELLRSRCEVCHSLDYVVQQRLSAAQWDKVLTKMQKWGATLSVEEKQRLGPFLAKTWDAALPDVIAPLSRTP